MGTASGFNGPNLIGLQSFVPDEEFGVLTGENVVGHHAQPEAIPQATAKSQYQRGLARPDRSPHAHGKCPLAIIAVSQRHASFVKQARVVHVFMGMSVPSVIMVVIVRMRVMHEVRSHSKSELLTLKQPGIEAIVGCLKDVNDGCGLRYVFLTLFATPLGNAFAKRSETVLDRLALQGTDDAQPNGAGDQAPQGEKTGTTAWLARREHAVPPSRHQIGAGNGRQARLCFDERRSSAISCEAKAASAEARNARP